MEEGRKGGEIWSVGDIREVMEWGCGGGGENASGEVSVSCLRILSREEGRSQGGGRMLALRWRLRRRASQRGRGARCGGRRAGVGPWVGRSAWELVVSGESNRGGLWRRGVFGGVEWRGTHGE